MQIQLGISSNSTINESKTRCEKFLLQVVYQNGNGESREDEACTQGE